MRKVSTVLILAIFKLFQNAVLLKILYQKLAILYPKSIEFNLLEIRNHISYLHCINTITKHIQEWILC